MWNVFPFLQGKVYLCPMIIKRTITKSILKSLANNSVTAIIGARQVGKTTLAKEIIKSYDNAKYIDLEKSSDIAMLADAETYFNINKDVSLFCIDEIQLMPNLFNVLRSFVDEHKQARFLILGSASPKLLRQSAETLAGRIFYYTLSPFLYTEINDIRKVTDYHLLGGFPKSVLSQDVAYSFEWLRNFTDTFLQRDLQMFGYRIPPKMMHRLWVMIAHLNGQLLNYNMLSRSMGVDNKTIKKYIDMLHHTYMIRLLEPYHTNTKKRLVKSPKIYVKDTGILHSLLVLETYESIYNHPVFGSSWETMVIENILGTHIGWECFFYRTSSGAEIDLLLKRGSKIIAIEIKAGTSPKLTKGFWEAIKVVQPTASYIIAPVRETYPYGNGVMVYNLPDFLRLEL